LPPLAWRCPARLADLPVRITFPPNDSSVPTLATFTEEPEATTIDPWAAMSEGKSRAFCGTPLSEPALSAAPSIVTAPLVELRFTLPEQVATVPPLTVIPVGEVRVSPAFATMEPPD